RLAARRRPGRGVVPDECAEAAGQAARRPGGLAGSVEDQEVGHVPDAGDQADGRGHEPALLVVDEARVAEAQPAAARLDRAAALAQHVAHPVALGAVGEHDDAAARPGEEVDRRAVEPPARAPVVLADADARRVARQRPNARLVARWLNARSRTRSASISSWPEASRCCHSRRKMPRSPVTCAPRWNAPAPQSATTTCLSPATPSASARRSSLPTVASLPAYPA